MEKKPKPPRRMDVAGDLRIARLDVLPKHAERIVIDALKQQEAHLLEPDDLVWVVEKIGAWESSWRAGQAIAAWLYHHGPIHRGLVEAAEEIAGYDNAEWLDDVLLWIEPTPQRWYEHACWVTSRVGVEICFDREESSVANRKRHIVDWCADHARRVIAERGDAARRSLRAAPAIAEDLVKLTLDTWVEAIT